MIISWSWWHLAPCDSQVDTSCAQDHAFLAGCSSWGLWCPIGAATTRWYSMRWVVHGAFGSCWGDDGRLSEYGRGLDSWIFPTIPPRAQSRLIWAMRSKKVWSRPVLRLKKQCDDLRSSEHFTIQGFGEEKNEAELLSAECLYAAVYVLFLSIHSLSIFRRSIFRYIGIQFYVAFFCPSCVEGSSQDTRSDPWAAGCQGLQPCRVDCKWIPWTFL